MAIQFCKKCNTILESITKDNKQYLVCRKCETELYGEYDLTITTKIPIETKIGKGVAKKDIGLGQEFKCKKCGNDKCQTTDLGMMVGDEDWIYLLTCTKCGHSKRIGDWC
jgi:DNA-directed RNA polymerase subunit M/transcription elongation factor TFIIS